MGGIMEDYQEKHGKQKQDFCVDLSITFPLIRVSKDSESPSSYWNGDGDMLTKDFPSNCKCFSQKGNCY